MEKSRIIYVHVGLSSFVRKDIKILEATFDLDIFFFNLSSKVKLPLSFTKQFFFLLFRLRKSKGLVVQFGGYQSYLPARLGKFFGRKVIIVMGGTDSVSFPSIQYGCFYKSYLKYFTRKSLEKATLLLPVSETIISCKYTYTSGDFPEQGYLFHAPKTKTPAITIFNGYNSNIWEPSEVKEKNSFVTVAADLGTTFGKKLKGIDLILDVASDFKDCKFYVVGGDKLNEPLPQNVIPVANMPHEDLPKFISEKTFYLQLSMSEGFPNSLCEAMLSACIPIVSNVGAMPFIVNDIGFILERKDSRELVRLLKLALNSNTSDLAMKARKRIESEFPLQNRVNELTMAIKTHLLAQ